MGQASAWSSPGKVLTPPAGPPPHQGGRTATREVSPPSSCRAQQCLVFLGSAQCSSRSKVTLGVVAEQWMAGKINLKPTTRARYESALAVHVLRRWATVPLAAIEHGQIQAWL